MKPVAVRLLDTTQADFDGAFERVLHWSQQTDAEIETRVAAILEDVRARGDAAVLDCTARFDGLQARSLAELELGPADFAAGACCRRRAPGTR
ncbi:MAG TPA: histidinol dehydrogenase [Burkholderiaceae bacterium]|nr:histidinol dehydrogenase [Burkholderiaceae bacterium]